MAEAQSRGIDDVAQATFWKIRCEHEIKSQLNWDKAHGYLRSRDDRRVGDALDKFLQDSKAASTRNTVYNVRHDRPIISREVDSKLGLSEPKQTKSRVKQNPDSVESFLENYIKRNQNFQR